MVQRLQKLLAAAGIASRRSCEAMVAQGRVSVNGQIVTEPGAKADPETDDIRVDGRRIQIAPEHVYLVLNKPVGYVTTVRDPHATHTVMELVQGIPARVYPVGRLDADSAGLLLLTNDGAFTQTLTHPSHQVPKTYRAVVRGEVPAWAAADLKKGILLDDGMTAPAQVAWVDYDERNNASIIDLTIHEGRNRQVRRMFDAIGFPVLALTRIQIGPISLKGLAPGTWRKLHPAEVKALLDAADVEPPALPQVPQEPDLRQNRGIMEEPAIAEHKPQPSKSPAGRERSRPAPARPDPPHRKRGSSERGPVLPDNEAIRAAARELTERLRADAAPKTAPPETETGQAHAPQRRRSRKQPAS